MNKIELTDDELLALNQLLGAAEISLAQRGHQLDAVETRVILRAMYALDRYYDRNGVGE